MFYSPSPGPTYWVVLDFLSVIAVVCCAASWLLCGLLGPGSRRQQLQEARERESEDLPLVAPNTRHAPGFAHFPCGSVLSRLVDL
jgi:hypothetical protein